MRFLSERRCVVLDRNVYGDGGEIDLVIDDQGTIAAVEVKASLRGDPIDRVDDRKWATVQRTARATSHRIARFDILTVALRRTHADVRWLKGAD